MVGTDQQFTVRLARSEADIRAAQRLRYEVFVEELGGSGPLVDHEARLEQDRFDPYFDHLILADNEKDGKIIGVYRLLRDDMAAKAGQFYSEDEYDLAKLRASGRKLLELGRSCVAAPYRGGPALYHLWSGLASYVSEYSIELLFGVASFHGTDPVKLAEPLSLLHHRHLAPEPLRVRAQADHYQEMNLMPEDRIDRRRAMLQVPALIKAYLRLGGYVGEGAYVDKAFNTTDICLIMDTRSLNKARKSFYSKGVTI